MNLPLALITYQSFMKSDPTGKLAAAFVDELREAGEDVEQLFEAVASGSAPPPPRPAAVPRPYGDTPNAEHIDASARHVATARHGGDSVRSQLTGSARAELDRAMGIDHGGGAFGRGDGLPPIGPCRSPEGHLRLHLGDPGEWRQQEAAKAARRGR